MNTNNIKETKVLVIEDEEDHFNLIKSWLEEFDYIVIPEKFIEMENALKKRGQAIHLFVQQQLKKHSRDIGMILCDIKFGDDRQKGNKIVKRIRAFKDLTPYYWTSMAPIFGMTNYSDSETFEDAMIEAGADFVFKKKIIFDVLKEHEDNKENSNEVKTKSEKKKEADKLRTIIDRHVEKFQNNLTLFYCKGLESNILQFKEENKDRKTAFIMIDFRHLKIAEIVQSILLANGIYGFIANSTGGKFDEETWKNIQIYMHGCDFGISVFANDSERDSSCANGRNKINPNVCIEAGYMRCLQKEVLYLKDNSLDFSDLPSDFHGKLSTVFSNEHTLRVNLTELLNNRGLIEIS